MSTTLILGLGESGLAMAHWLARTCTVRVADTREAPPMLDALRAQLPQVPFTAGLSVNLLEGVTQVAISPGLSTVTGAAAPLVQAATERGIEVVGEIELFARALTQLKEKQGYAPRLIGVTGTNGKTTTARLAGLLIERSGKTVAVAGNIAPTALDSLMERMATNALPDVWVLELSSFQLATTQSLVCDVAAVLNLSHDHLDWHGSFDAYAQAKARIFAHEQTVQVLNRDDAAVMAMAHPKRSPITFGAAAPAQANAFGLVAEGSMHWLAWAEDLSPPQRKRKAASELPGVTEAVHVHRLMPAEALRIRGRHNALNALAALALAHTIDCPLAPMLHALRVYAGEPHRLSSVCMLDGVEYYDDSKGTNVGASLAAIEGLGAENKKLVVILGGDGKGQAFEPLAPALARYARAVVLIGRDAPLIENALTAEQGDPERPYVIERAADLTSAVQACVRLAQGGDAVLLSPACASLDMFKDYVHRAQVYVETVHAIAAERGQLC